MATQTVWKDIEGYEGIYQVSNSGLVRSKDRTITSLDGKSYRYKGKLFKPKKHMAGYHFVELSKKTASVRITTYIDLCTRVHFKSRGQASGESPQGRQNG